MAKVIHKKHAKNSKDEIYIGRGSLYGNPWTSKNLSNTSAKFQAKSRKDSVEQYKRWLLGIDHNYYYQIRRKKILASLPYIRNKTLVCFCAPLLCHGNILSDLADNHSE